MIKVIGRDPLNVDLGNEDENPLAPFMESEHNMNQIYTLDLNKS